MSMTDALTDLCRLPVIPDVHLKLDETGEYPALSVISPRRLTKAEISACHYAAGELGATIQFHCPR